MIPSVTALIVSCQVVLGTFFLSILGIKHTRHPVTAAKAPSQDSPVQDSPVQNSTVQDSTVLDGTIRDEPVNHREQSAAAPRL
jgi:hypothetical protein